MNRGMTILRGLAVAIAACLLLAVGGAGFRAGSRPPRDFALQAESPQFWDLVDHNAKLNTVATGFGFTEGPVWDEAGFLYVSDETINKKLNTALKHDLVPIVCVGEVLAEREGGKTEEVLLRQTRGVLAGISAGKAAPIVIAYEPVWAIGTGKTATPQIAAEAHKVIRGEVAKLLGAQVADNLRILYGGSVKPDNATSLMNEAEIDGALVGGASLDAQSFAKIVNY